MGYLEKAAEACAGGDLLLGMHLYLAAYEQAASDDSTSTSVEVTALREAWHLACDLKERSLAEYVFEKLEPYLTGEEIAECAMKLQELALDRLEQYGFSREDLEDMAESITQDFLGDNARVVKVESVSIPNMGMFGVPDATVEATIVEKAPQVEAAVEVAEAAEAVADVEHGGPLPAQRKPRAPQVDMGIADVNDFNPYDQYRSNSVGTSYHAATTEGSGAYVFTRDEERATALERAQKAEAEKGTQAASAEAVEQPVEQAEQAEPAVQAEQPAESAQSAAPPATLEIEAAAPVDLKAAAETPTAPAAASAPAAPANANAALSYRSLVGYDETISVMRDIGVGLFSDPGFQSFVRMLNSRHGLSRMPVIDTLLFRAPAIEDATRFAEATVGELGLPVLRMSMEEGVGGMPVLCVTTQGNNRPRMNHAHNRFEGPGILVIEDLDAWALPEMPEAPEGMGGFGNFIMANISRGAREAVELIRSAVEDPDVFVLVTATTGGEPDPFFYEVLEPITIIDIGYPTDKERADIWAEIARDHPSVRGVNRDDLVRYSEGLVRYDLYMAAREAVEDAYKSGLVQRMFVPVTPQNLYDKLAAFQPLDSDRYHELEDAVVSDFRNDLDHLEDLLP